jgi:hypothetical protein
MSNVIVIPVYQSAISEWEMKSFEQCCKVLSKHTLCLVTYAELDCTVYEEIAAANGVHLPRENFDCSYFKGLQVYNKLMISRAFYQRFARYDYMLIYQLDAFVFRDELDKWCMKDYDYIGAPWFDNYMSYEEGAKLWKVGNGGFSLRRVKTFIDILSEKKPILQYRALYERYKSYPLRVRYWCVFKALLGWHNTIGYYVGEYMDQEDLFWTQYIPSLGFKIKIPSPQQAMAFSFERSPAYLYKQNNQQLPFGCHAWKKYDYETFWCELIKK